MSVGRGGCGRPKMFFQMVIQTVKVFRFRAFDNLAELLIHILPVDIAMERVPSYIRRQH